jgi:hypothetical protein
LADAWQLTDWTTKKEGLETQISNITTALSTLPEDLAAASSSLKLQDQRTTLAGEGFDADKLSTLDETQLNKLTSFTSQESSDSIKDS